MHKSQPFPRLPALAALDGETYNTGIFRKAQKKHSGECPDNVPTTQKPRHTLSFLSSAWLPEKNSHTYAVAPLLIQKPKLLLLDEHTAALDPKTAAKVLEISDKIIAENHLTAMMVTHNMRDAIAHGNRLIMMHEGKVILNIAGEEKKKLTVEDLLHQFERVSGEEFANDKALLS